MCRTSCTFVRCCVVFADIFAHSAVNKSDLFLFFVFFLSENYSVLIKIVRLVHDHDKRTWPWGRSCPRSARKAFEVKKKKKTIFQKRFTASQRTRIESEPISRRAEPLSRLAPPPSGAAVVFRPSDARSRETAAAYDASRFIFTAVFIRLPVRVPRGCGGIHCENSRLTVRDNPNCCAAWLRSKTSFYRLVSSSRRLIKRATVVKKINKTITFLRSAVFSSFLRNTKIIIIRSSRFSTVRYVVSLVVRARVSQHRRPSRTANELLKRSVLRNEPTTTTSRRDFIQNTNSPVRSIVCPNDCCYFFSFRRPVYRLRCTSDVCDNWIASFFFLCPIYEYKYMY